MSRWALSAHVQGAIYKCTQNIAPFMDRVHNRAVCDLAQRDRVCATRKRDGLSMSLQELLPLRIIHSHCTGKEGQPLQVSGTRHKGIVHGGQENKVNSAPGIAAALSHQQVDEH